MRFTEPTFEGSVLLTNVYRPHGFCVPRFAIHQLWLGTSKAFAAPAGAAPATATQKIGIPRAESTSCARRLVSPCGCVLNVWTQRNAAGAGGWPFHSSRWPNTKMFQSRPHLFSPSENGAIWSEFRAKAVQGKRLRPLEGRMDQNGEATPFGGPGPPLTFVIVGPEELLGGTASPLGQRFCHSSARQ